MVTEAVEVAAAGELVVVETFPQPDWETARRCGTRNLIQAAQTVGLDPRIHPVAPSDGASR
jgi:hypothetical protein